jgi:hypothetical protein
MTPTRYLGDAPCEPHSGTLLRFAGNCTATVSIKELHSARIGLELHMTPKRPPREGSLTVNCLWARRGTTLCDRQCVDLSLSSTPPPARPGALVRALLDALRRSDTDVECDTSLRAALHDAVVTARVRLVTVTAIVMGADSDGNIRPHGHRAQYVPLIVRFLPVLQ